MDAIALLCTLHADGPTTLKTLRAAGIENLDALEQRGPDALARVLGVAPAFARRFLRESRALRERLVDDPREPEMGGLETAPAPRLPQPAPPARTVARAAPARPIVDRVLEQWRSADERRPDAQEPVPAALALSEGRLDGLDARTLTQLEEAGIRTLSGLAGLSDSDTLELCRDVRGGFSGLRRLVFLAGRALADLPAEARAAAAARPAPQPERLSPRVEPTPAPAPTPVGITWEKELRPHPPRPPMPQTEKPEGAGGPFA